MASKQQKPGAHKKSPTAAQHRAWDEMRVLSEAWNIIMEEQRQAWNAAAHTNRRGGRAARKRRRSGRCLFFRVNSHRLALGQSLLACPSGPANSSETPTVRLVITNSGVRIALKLHVLGGPAAGVMVSASRPCNAGVMACRKLARIGPMPEPVGEMSDITRQYLAKYREIPIGKKIFIGIQQMNDYLGSIVYVTSAIVPPGPSGGGKAKTPINLAKTWRMGPCLHPACPVLIPCRYRARTEYSRYFPKPCA